MDLDYISELVQALLLATLPVLAAQLSAFLFQAYKAKRAELDERQRWMLDQVVGIAVLAAEQIYENGDGAEKKAYALNVAEEWIAKRGLTLDLELLNAQIEAAVYSQVEKEFPPPMSAFGVSVSS